MYTWQHGFWIYFFTRKHPKVWYFVAGSMLPDYIYPVLLAVMMGKGELGFSDLLKVSPKIMMSYLPMYPWAAEIDLIGHSAVVWSVALIMTLFSVFRTLQAFVIGWGTHLLIDGLTHGAFANLWLYPLSTNTVISPVSYWEQDYHSREFQIVNGMLMALCAGYLFYNYWKRRK